MKNKKIKNLTCPLSKQTQDKIAIVTMKKMLESMICAKPESTTISYIETYDGGIVETNFICDVLQDSELRTLMDLFNPIARDGAPGTSISIHYIWDKTILDKLTEDKDFFQVDVLFTYTKNDWAKMLEAV